MPDNDVAVLQDLARQVAEIAAKPIQNQRRDLWRRHNSFQRTRPLVLMMGMPFWPEVFPFEQLQCRDPLFRAHEVSLRQKIHQDRLDDDTVIEPWINVSAVYQPPNGEQRWGADAPIRFIPSTEQRGAGLYDPPIKGEDDLGKLAVPRHALDEQATTENLKKVQDAVGEALQVCLDRGPLLRHWAADISTDIARLRGLGQFMLDMMDRPRWLHRMLAFMRDGVLKVQQEAEDAGDWRLFHHNNQAMPYSRELADPVADGRAAKRKELWVFFASQETTLVSPAMFDEFILQYQIPIIANFGLSAYGCCEDLTRKIDRLRKIPNLRRISVTPFADVRACAEQIGTDYILSWRPSPSEMICRGFDPARARKLTRAGLAACKGCHVDINLKDVETIAGNFDNLVQCVRIMREEAERL